MPTIAVHDLVIHPRDNELVVGTHGRGVYITDISPLQQLGQGVLSRPVYLFDIKPTVQWHMTGQPAVSAQNFAGENASFAVDVYYYLMEPLTGEIRIAVYSGDERIFDLPGTNEAGLNRVQWFMTRREMRNSEDKEEWQIQQQEIESEPEFFDYYDTVDIFPEPGVEVDRFGRSLDTRVHPDVGLTDREFRYIRVPPGKYRVELETATSTFSTEAQVLADEWYEK
jgi:hypothetical protein